ncbi:MAG: hypothetical protein ACRESC_02315, partial [Gammaproteobacteria bacterium]
MIVILRDRQDGGSPENAGAISGNGWNPVLIKCGLRPLPFIAGSRTRGRVTFEMSKVTKTITRMMTPLRGPLRASLATESRTRYI